LYAFTPSIEVFHSSVIETDVVATVEMLVPLGHGH
jgi:hypothetical protein